MKKITKDNKGITLIALVMTVILMLILLSVTTYTGINTYEESKSNAFVTKMQLLQAKVDDLVNSKTDEELNSLGLQDVTTDEQKNAISNAFNNEEVTTNDINNYKVFTKENVLTILDVEDIESDIIVNLTTREIINVTGIEYDGITYYTQYKLPNGQTIINGSDITRQLDFEMQISMNGLNSTVTVKGYDDTDVPLISNGTLSYKEQNDSNWQTVTNYTEANKTYNAIITKTGNYTFKLQDNTNSETYTEKLIVITVANKPKTSLELDEYNYGEDSDVWAYITDTDGKIYVWIPRFVYKTNTETNTTEAKFIKGNSNIATDNTYINNSWSIHSKFKTEQEIELTGIWVNVDTANQTGLDMMELLDSDAETLMQI